MSRSLYERLLIGGHPQFTITIQYRMHPHISFFPSRYFYNGQLEDCASIKAGSHHVPWLHRDPRFPPYAVYNIPSSRESRQRDSQSCCNHTEAQICMTLVLTLLRTHPEACQLSIGIITPYRDQLNVIDSRRQHAAADISTQRPCTHCAALIFALWTVSGSAA